MELHGLPNRFWIVLAPSPNSQLADICFECDFEGFARQVRGGLDETSIRGIFAEEGEAVETAKALLHLAEEVQRTPGVRIHPSPWPDWFATQESLDGVRIYHKGTSENILIEPPKEWGHEWTWNFTEDGSGIVIFHRG